MWPRGGLEEGKAQEMGSPQMGWNGVMPPEIVIMKIEENQPSMENMCVKSEAIRFLSSTSASVASEFNRLNISVPPFLLFICQQGRRRRGNIQLILLFG